LNPLAERYWKFQHPVHVISTLRPFQLVFHMQGIKLSSAYLYAAWEQDQASHAFQDEICQYIAKAEELKIQLDCPNSSLPSPIVSAALKEWAASDDIVEMCFALESDNEDLMQLTQFLNSARTSAQN
jgi:hypothetical protein